MVEQRKNESKCIAKYLGEKPDHVRREYKPPTLEKFRISAITKSGGSAIPDAAGSFRP
jgi:hypothetical protein